MLRSNPVRVPTLCRGDSSNHRIEATTRTREDANDDEPGRSAESAIEPNTGLNEDQQREGELDADAGEFRPARAAIAPPKLVRPAGTAPTSPVHARRNLGACEIFRKQSAAPLRHPARPAVTSKWQNFKSMISQNFRCDSSC